MRRSAAGEWGDPGNRPGLSRGAREMSDTGHQASPAPVTLGTRGVSLKARVARSIFWLAWSRGVVQVLSFAATVLIARILAPAEYGGMALAGCFIGTANMLAAFVLARSVSH